MAQTRHPSTAGSQAGVLRLVAVFKFVKAALLIVLGIGILRLVHADLATQLNHWIATLGLDPGSRLINHFLQRVTNLPPRRIRELGIGSLAYAALFLTEGTGLWLLKRWAEWFTVIATGSLIPMEGYELHRHPTAVKFLLLLVNVAVVAYLLWRIRHERDQH